MKTVGKSASGVPLKTWRYKTDPLKRRYLGTTAQALAKHNPAAVVTDPISGVQAVDYSRTDVPFGEVPKGKRLNFATGRLVEA